MFHYCCLYHQTGWYCFSHQGELVLCKKVINLISNNTCQNIQMCHSSKHPHLPWPHIENWKLTPPPPTPLDDLIHLLLSETIFSPPGECESFLDWPNKILKNLCEKLWDNKIFAKNYGTSAVSSHKSKDLMPFSTLILASQTNVCSSDVDMGEEGMVV